MKKIYLILIITFCNLQVYSQPCPAQPLNYPCDASNNPTWTNYDDANIWIQQDSINAILRRILHRGPLMVTACPSLPLNYPCDASNNPTWTSYDLANIWIQQDTTIVLLRALLAGGGGGGGHGGPVIDSAWLLFGNSGTTPLNNWIGTNDAAPLEFKTNNTFSGYIDPASTELTSFGFSAGGNPAAIGYGGGNTAMGYNCIAANTTGLENTAVGAFALAINTTGSGNVAMGTTVFVALNGGSNNTGIGNLSFNVSGSYSSNTGIGSTALFENQGDYNSATGDSAGFNNQTGFYNTYDGYAAGSNNSTGSSNVYIGNYSGFNDAGSFNTFLGDSTGQSGFGIHRINQTAVGYGALCYSSNSITIGNTNVLEIVTEGDISPGGPGNFGTSGQVLISQGSGVAPVWGNVTDSILVAGTGISIARSAPNIITISNTGSAFSSATQNVSTSSPTTPVSCTSGKNKLFLVITIVGSGSPGVITLPSAPVDGQEVTIVSSNALALNFATFSPAVTIITTTTSTTGIREDLEWDSGTSHWNQIQ